MQSYQELYKRIARIDIGENVMSAQARQLFKWLWVATELKDWEVVSKIAKQLETQIKQEFGE